jgi:hypothetical protein
MAQQVKAKAGFVGLPGISDQCRYYGTVMNCGYNYQQCLNLPRTKGTLFYYNLTLDKLLSLSRRVDLYVKDLIRIVVLK